MTNDGTQKPLLQIIIGSVRPGRVGLSIAHWFESRARTDGRFDLEMIDLAEVGLPMMDEPNHPVLQQYTKDHTKRWSERIGRADAYVFVIPEYDYSLNAATKNAIEYLVHEWARKPLGIVSYGGVSGGLRAAQQLKQTGAALRMLVMPDLVMVPMVRERIDEDGAFMPSAIHEESAVALLDETATLLQASRALRP